MNESFATPTTAALSPEEKESRMLLRLLLVVGALIVLAFSVKLWLDSTNTTKVRLLAQIDITLTEIKQHANQILGGQQQSIAAVGRYGNTLDNLSTQLAATQWPEWLQLQVDNGPRWNKIGKELQSTLYQVRRQGKQADAASKLYLTIASANQRFTEIDNSVTELRAIANNQQSIAAINFVQNLNQQIATQLRQLGQNGKNRIDELFVMTQLSKNLVSASASSVIQSLNTDLSSKLKSRSVSLQQDMQTIVEHHAELTDAREFAQALVTATELTQQDTSNKLTALNQIRLHPLSIIIILFGMAFAILLWRTINRLRTQQHRQLGRITAERDRTQTSILRLLDDISSLADGNLTVRASVTEDITGAVADSINYAIEELSHLVTNIRQNSERINRTGQHTQASATKLLNDMSDQAEMIAGIKQTALGISSSMRIASRIAAETANVASAAAEAANEGVGAMSQATVGMQRIRERIQDTAKRIKRLGESSQEIGEINALVSGISEQTNVIALNASIQAAHESGEDNDEFSAVSDEVQRLAERIAQASQHIASIIQTIQTDTRAAVMAMELATRDVVEGTQLVDQTNQTLIAIQQRSDKSSLQVSELAALTETQSELAREVADQMMLIQQVNDATVRSAHQTDQAMYSLSELSNELREAVSGFKMQDDSVSTVNDTQRNNTTE